MSYLSWVHMRSCLGDDFLSVVSAIFVLYRKSINGGVFVRYGGVTVRYRQAL